VPPAPPSPAPPASGAGPPAPAAAASEPVPPASTAQTQPQTTASGATPSQVEAAAPQADPRVVAPRVATPPEAPLPTPVSSDAALTVPEVISVEDDTALAELLEYGLEARGYRFKAYRNGRDALRDLLELDVQGTKPLLLLDVDLPALDGYSIFNALEQQRPGTYRVVFTTVHGTEEEQLRGLEAGALDYLVKPISLRVALEKIKRWVGR
jgi:CheY-like chemotaxis protein